MLTWFGRSAPGRSGNVETQLIGQPANPRHDHHDFPDRVVAYTPAGLPIETSTGTSSTAKPHAATAAEGRSDRPPGLQKLRAPLSGAIKPAAASGTSCRHCSRSPLQPGGMRDFGRSKFGGWLGDSARFTRRVDFLGRSPHEPPGSVAAMPFAAVDSRYLTGVRRRSVKELAEKAVVLIAPRDRAGELLWPVSIAAI